MKLRYSISELRSVTRCMGSHCYLPPDTGEGAPPKSQWRLRL